MFTDHLTEIKLTLAAGVGSLAWLADASESLGAKGWEELGLKAILGGAVVFIGKLFLNSETAHKAEIKALVESHRAEIRAMVEEHHKAAHERETKLVEALTTNSEVLNNVAILTKEQTDWYRATAKVMLEQRIKTNLPKDD